ncbi:MAG: molecular chaperone HtpG [Oscillospiraceae bacterium]|nr:molecular chaperone HtpG [Oscillospiraceae bacterium]
MANGALSVDTEHLFPIIKKWLYSEKDIYLREVLSNACDAVTKHKRLVSLGEAAEGDAEYRIDIRTDAEARTLTVTDNGIGMTRDEVETYINNIALSGAVDFISKYEGEGGSGIIGHFGLGFYSMFMVADRVVMQTKSYQDAPAVCWECDEAGNYEMSEGNRETRGTEITMYLMEDEGAYCNAQTLKTILERYCSFMPVPIYLHDGEKEEQINETVPLWQRSASDCTDEEYKEFYKKQFHDYADPLFWVHINADYPLNFKGILYFPQRKNAFDAQESEIRLFYNSVFVADNIKEVCPEFLVNLKGVLDCPELPLNVSRSYLQNDAYVRKVASHIVKKVSDRLNQLFNQNREEYEKNWEGIKPYIEYGCIRDAKFAEKTEGVVLFEKATGGWCTLDEYLEGKEEGTVYYTTDPKAQSYYLSLFEQKNVPVLLFDTLMDTNYAQFRESKNEKIKFRRIDSDLEAVKDGEQETETEALEALFCKATGKELPKKDEDGAKPVTFVSLGEEDAPALVSVSEESRRMAEMMRMYSIQNGREDFSFPVEEGLTVNLANPLVKKLATLTADDEKALRIAKHIYLSAVLLARPLKPEEQKEFLALNREILMEL